MKPTVIFLIAATATLLAACTSTQVSQSAPQWPVGKTLTDTQGEVSISVTPIDSPDSELMFDVLMDTHSIELNIDLAQTSSVATDNGLEVTPLSWDGPNGGHHVTGLLSFPKSIDGIQILNGATQITLVIRGVDGPERSFVWDLE